MTAVLTTAVSSFSWFSPVLFMNSAVVYLSQKDMFCAATVLIAPATARDLKSILAVFC